MTAIGRQAQDRLQAIDPIWDRVREEALEAADREPVLSGFFYSTVLNHKSLEAAVVHRISQRLDHADVPAILIAQAFAGFQSGDTLWCEMLRSDLQAVLDRDPACDRFIEPLLYFKGFHAIQTHRLAHWLWNAGRRDFALYLQSRSSAVFQTDINPASKLGRGLFLDHATGIVIGQTAEIGDNVSILQDVTLGGNGKEHGDRHPKIGNGVLIGAGAKVLGNIRIGECSKVAAGSVVLKAVPPHTTVAGVPAKIVGSTDDCCGGEPGRAMNHMFGRED
ncbi:MULTISPECIES: serine O-acetyltransferase [unclassified Aureimonas]|uniref:serine O-acetyltransferase n=1 Tax=unclassified Aureimonas TaxID=2615206 RepID=UPI0006F2679C|nr:MULTISPECIES: serine O-acetyltransferase [unclassified Aureimonas]KQT57516.1 serine acetyltransferase [Aureimonas sp. Leaf427]KQT77196.1 serine acetyltransferase [Aureimonas sp. Leaf460]